MNIQPILAAAAALQSQLPPILEQLKDTSIPLDERWEVYTVLVDQNLFVKDDGYGDGELRAAFDPDRVSLYDDFHLDRGQSMTFPEMWEAMNDEDFEGGDVYDAEGAKDKWREAVLASGYSSFTYDW